MCGMCVCVFVFAHSRRGSAIAKRGLGISGESGDVRNGGTIVRLLCLGVCECV